MDVRNARGHSPSDLATAQEVKDLIKKATHTKSCVICGSKFDFKNIRYYCESCTRFLCIQCSTSQTVYESVESEEKERPVCRCKDCLHKIRKAEEDMSAAIKTMDYPTVDKAYFAILHNHIDIDVKTLHLAQVTHLKLKQELDIMEFIKSKAHVEDYKTILKSVKILNDMVANAKALGVDLDPLVMQSVNQCTSRLIAERNLRFHMDMSEHIETNHE